ncbi:MAG TPA: hypothetical protein V6D16_09935 [Candidatus Obscuribacterales bacterium]
MCSILSEWLVERSRVANPIQSAIASIQCFMTALVETAIYDRILYQKSGES